MNKNSKIEPFLLQNISNMRKDLLQKTVDEVFDIEITEEHIKEKIYDEDEKLKKEIIIDRKIFKGDTYSIYSSFLNDLLKEGTDKETLKLNLNKKLDDDTKIIISEIKYKKSLKETLKKYNNFIGLEKWPSFYTLFSKMEDLDELKAEFRESGFLIEDNDKLEKFRILRFKAPPEEQIISEITKNPKVLSLTDPKTPVIRPVPMKASTMVSDSRDILNVNENMMDNYANDITIAILDTGIDKKHPSFSRFSAEDYFNFLSSEEDDRDFEGHGTHCAGIAGGNDITNNGQYSGIAPNCHLIYGKVLSGDGHGSLESILDGMAWAVVDKKADIISLSLGESFTPPNGMSIWSQACDEAFLMGTIVCVAAGNVSPSGENTITVPADSKTAVSVGAIDKNTYLADFSAKGSRNSNSALYKKPNCVAPGVDIVSARSEDSDYYPYSDDKLYTCLSGTSMATPAVAGCFALIKSFAYSRGWKIKAAELKEIYFEACSPVSAPSKQPYSSEYEIGYGLVDMEKAFSLIEAITGSQHSKAESEVEGASGDISSANAKNCAQFFTPGPQSPGLSGLPAGHAEEKVTSRLVENVNKIKVIKESGVAKLTHSIPKYKTDIGLKTLITGRIEDKLINSKKIKLSNYKSKIKIKEKQKSSYNRKFGTVVQYSIKKGFLWFFWRRVKVVIALIYLDNEGIKTTDKGNEPIENIISEISGRNGLELKNNITYTIGIFSPVGWPKKTKKRIQVSGNTDYYLLEPNNISTERSWNVYGKPGEIGDIFDPELENERRERILSSINELKSNWDGPERLSEFLAENNLTKNRQIVIDIIMNSFSSEFSIKKDNDGSEWISRLL